MTFHPKVTASALAGAVATLIFSGLTAAGIHIPDPDVSAVTVVLTFLAGYLTPSTPPTA